MRSWRLRTQIEKLYAHRPSPEVVEKIPLARFGVAKCGPTLTTEKMGHTRKQLFCLKSRDILISPRFGSASAESHEV